MKKLLTVSIGGLLGTLAIFCFLKSKKEQVSSIATSDLGFPGAAPNQVESTVKDTMHETGAVDEEVKRQLAIVRLQAFLLAVRRNQTLAH